MAVERWLKLGCKPCTVTTSEHRTEDVPFTELRYGDFKPTSIPLCESIRITSLSEPHKLLRRVPQNRHRINGIQRVLPICQGPTDGKCPFEERVEAIDSALTLQAMETGPIIMDLDNRQEGNEN